MRAENLRKLFRWRLAGSLLIKENPRGVKNRSSLTYHLKRLLVSIASLLDCVYTEETTEAPLLHIQSKTLNPTSPLSKLPSSDRHTEPDNKNIHDWEEKADGVSQKSSVTTWRLMVCYWTSCYLREDRKMTHDVCWIEERSCIVWEQRRIEERRCIVHGQIPKENRRCLASACGVWRIEERRCTVMWTRIERRLQTSSINMCCLVDWRKKMYCKWKETERRPQTSSVNTCYLVDCILTHWEEMLPAGRAKKEPQTSSVNRWRLVVDCTVQYIEWRCYLDEDRKRTSTSSVNMWRLVVDCTVQYIEKRSYLDEDRKRTADVYRQQVTSGGDL